MIPRSAEDICNLALLRAGVNERISDIDATDTVSQACKTAYDEHRRTLIMEQRPLWAIKREALTPYSGDDYAAATAFGLGAYAQYGANVYRSLQAANTGHQPDESPAWWAQVTRDGWGYVCPLPTDCLDPMQAWEAPTVSANEVASMRDPDDAFNLRNPLSQDKPPFALENSDDGSDNVVLLTDFDTPILKYIADVTNPSAYPSPFVQALAWFTGSDLASALRGDEKKAGFCMGMGERDIGKAFIIDQRDQQGDPEPISEFEAARKGLT